MSDAFENKRIAATPRNNISEGALTACARGGGW